MKLHPIIAAMRRQYAGAILIALQIALTLAIVCNAMFIIAQRVSRIDRPTGLQEDGLYWVTQQWVLPAADDPTKKTAQLDAMQVEDMAALRRIPGVTSVASVNTLPLLNSSRDGGVALEPNQASPLARTVYYYGDENMLSTLGAHLVEGREFTSGDVLHEAAQASHTPSVVIITKELAKSVFGESSALGKSIYLDGSGSPSRIVGIIDRLQVSTTHSWADTFTYHSTLVPVRLSDDSSTYAVRTTPQALDKAIRATASTLYGVSSARVIAEDGIRSYAAIREDAYRADMGMAILMASICAILLAVTAAGIVGLTSFWVAQRGRQIGIRRALGARKIDIFQHFHLENLFISSVGAVVGIVVAFALNAWLIEHYEMRRIPIAFVLLASLLVVATGQFAVFVPARRASKITPMAAMSNRTN
ncbi:putative ABC transport system permease protein [Rhodanobacter sp. K2T2]|uniref:ABC transporter permease n=1 Tax=Rhodanobacter sp. K2T2 TaxID=2723085 RepID=UPI0015CE930E|nr:FtsX-like permease family protein [Rhodanobacter sp. K2T2]NYE28911.1 putative ABC transport system permease protein [Rhodanobacter sp. K2T2]